MTDPIEERIAAFYGHILALEDVPGGPKAVLTSDLLAEIKWLRENSPTFEIAGEKLDFNEAICCKYGWQSFADVMLRLLGEK